MEPAGASTALDLQLDRVGRPPPVRAEHDQVDVRARGERLDQATRLRVGGLGAVHQDDGLVA